MSHSIDLNPNQFARENWMKSENERNRLIQGGMDDKVTRKRVWVLSSERKSTKSFEWSFPCMDSKVRTTQCWFCVQNTITPNHKTWEHQISWVINVLARVRTSKHLNVWKWKIGDKQDLLQPSLMPSKTFYNPLSCLSRPCTNLSPAQVINSLSCPGDQLSHGGVHPGDYGSAWRAEWGAKIFLKIKTRSNLQELILLYQHHRCPSSRNSIRGMIRPSHSIPSIRVTA